MGRNKIALRLLILTVISLMITGMMMTAYAKEIEVNNLTTLNDAIQEASAGDTIKLTDSIDIDSVAYVYFTSAFNDVIIDFDGNTVNFTGSTPIMGLLFYGKNITLKGGTITSNVGDSASTITLVGASIILEDMDVVATKGFGVNLYQGNSSLTIDADSTVTSKTVAAVAAYGSGSAHTIDVYGTVTHTGTHSAINASYDCTGTVDITIYEDATVNGGSNGAGILQMANGTVTIEGGTVTGESGIAITKGELIISDGEITGIGEYKDYEPSHGNGQGTGGTVVANGAAVYIEPAGNVDVTIEGGTFTSTNSAAISAPADDGKNDKLTIDIVSIDSDDDTIIHFTTKDEAQNWYIGEENATEIAELAEAGDEIEVLQGDCELTNLKNGVTVKNSGAGEVVANDQTIAKDNEIVIGAVAEINGKQYASLEAAVEAAKAASESEITITILKNIELDNYVKIKDISAKLTIDLKEYTISASAPTTIWVEHVNVIFTGNEGSAIISETSIGLAVKGSTRENDKNYTTVTIEKNVAIYGYAYSILIDQYNSDNPFCYGVTVDIHGILVAERDDQYTAGGVYVNGSVKHTTNCPVITIHEGASIEADGTAIYGAGYAIWNIEGGSLKGGESGLAIKAGVWNISGNVTIYCDGEPDDDPDLNYNGVNGSGAAIQIESNPGYAGEIEITIKGGKFTSEKGCSVFEYPSTGDETKVKSITISDGKFKGDITVSTGLKDFVITGGYYTVDPTEFLGEGLEAVTSDDTDYNFMVSNKPATKPSTGSSSGGSSSTTYKITVTVAENGKVSPNGTVRVTKGKDQKFVITPNEGYEVEDVLVDGESVGAVTEYTFEDVREAHTLEVTFVLVEEDSDESEEKDTYVDVPATAWYYDAVEFVTENELMQGTGSNKFEPDLSITRGMIATVLYRLAGVEVTETSTFDDVSSSAYYSNAIAWAAENGIVTGVGNNLFEPDRAITREELATMVSRYLDNMEVELESTSSDSADYNDAEAISDYAVVPVRTMKLTGLMIGKGNNNFDPAAMATRAEVATILMRFVQMTTAE